MAYRGSVNTIPQFRRTSVTSLGINTEHFIVMCISFTSAGVLAACQRMLGE